MNIRINNIGARPAVYLGKAPEDAHLHVHIVKYNVNEKYGKLEEYLKDGWEDQGRCICKPQMSIDKNCFLDKEYLYTVAYLNYEEDNYFTRLESVGERLLELSKEERNDFWEVYEIANRKLLEIVDNRKNDLYQT